MLRHSLSLLLLVLPYLALAHFELVWPPARDADEEQMGKFPCGGKNTPSEKRTDIPLNGYFPIQLDMGHTETQLQVVIALGNAPTGDDFSTILRPTFQEEGPNDFCIDGLRLPKMIGGRPLTSGAKATIQVLANNEDGGGLYNCADITFTNMTLPQRKYNDNCKNSKGVQSSAMKDGQTMNANGTKVQGEVAANASPPSSSTSSQASSSESQGAAPLLASSASLSVLGVAIAVVFGV